MKGAPEGRNYIHFDPKGGCPAGDGLYFECSRCGDALPSLPPDSIMCTCRNIRIDVGYGRVSVSDHAFFRIFRVFRPE